MGILVEETILFMDAVPVIKPKEPKIDRVSLIWEGPYIVTSTGGKVSRAYGDAISSLFNRTSREAESLVKKSYEEGEVTVAEMPRPLAEEMAKKANDFVYANLKEPFMPALLFMHQRR